MSKPQKRDRTTPGASTQTPPPVDGETSNRQKMPSAPDWLEKLKPPKFVMNTENQSTGMQSHFRPLDPSGRFLRRCDALQLTRYKRELMAIEDSELPHFPHFGQFRKLWRERKHPWDSAIIYGATGNGKSIMALWACRETVHSGGTFDWFDFMEMPTILASESNWERLKSFSEVDLLVIDEVGDSEDLRGRPFAEIKHRINLRYRNSRPTILCSIVDEKRTKDKPGLEDILGPQILRRFPLRIGG